MTLMRKGCHLFLALAAVCICIWIRSAGASTGTDEIVFIDAAVQDTQVLTARLRPGTEIVRLQRHRDGVLQIAAHLEGRGGISAIHIISHGQPGKIFLGTAELSADTLAKYGQSLQAVADSLGKNSEILLYGCDVAKDKVGEGFVRMLAEATGANVAASVDKTGPERLGGNGTLEFFTGPVAGRVLAGFDRYPHVLAAITYTFDSDVQGWTGATWFAGYGGPQILAGSGSSELSFYPPSARYLQTMQVHSYMGTGQNFHMYVMYQGEVKYSATITTSTSWESHTINQNFDRIRFVNDIGGGNGWFYPGIDNVATLDEVGNSAPTVTGTSSTSITTAQTATPFSTLTVADADLDSVSLTITYTGANGTLSGTGLSGSAGSYTMSSASANTIQSQLRALVFTPTEGQVPLGNSVATTFTITPNDGHVSGTANAGCQVSATATYPRIIIGNPDDNLYAYITNVTIGTINNTSTYTSTNNQAAYSDYSATQNTNVWRGSTQTLSVTLGSDNVSGQAIAAFFDWNNDGDFSDAGETVPIVTLASGGTTNAGPYSASFTVPTNATLGAIRMRVVTDYNRDPLTNGNIDYGEAEDYTITVNPAPTPDTGSATGITATGATLNGTVNDNGVAVTSLYFDYGTSAPAYGSTRAGTPATLSAGAGSTAVTGAITGLTCETTYHFRINAVHSNGTIYGSDKTFTTGACNVPPTLAANTGLTLDQTASATTITTAKLQVTDVEQAAAALTYTVGTAPTKGTLKKSGTALVATNTFTQDDIDNNRITYTPNGTLNGADTFTFTVSDGAGGSIGSTSFAIAITDNVAPTVTSVTVPSNSTYVAGQNLDFVVNFSETVTISGTDSTLGLTIGSTARTAAYLSKTATSITYRYTVQSGDNDSDGIAVGSLTLNGTMINDGANNTAISALNSVGSTTLIFVDSVAPTVSSVSVPSDATYKTGANLDFTVDFSENVTVNLAGGTPYIPITLNTGGTVHAAYISGSGSSALVFRYTIVSGNSDPDGITVGSSITANGGTIRDAAATDATLALNSVASTTLVLVDAIAPAVMSVAVPINATYIAGQNLDFTVNFSKTVTVTGIDSTLGLTLGSTARTAAYLSKTATSITYRYTVQNGDADSDGVTVGALTLNTTTIKDAVGNDATLTLNSIGITTGVLVDAIAPSVTSVTAPANATYTTGQNLDFTVNWSENVTVTGTDSTLGLTIGSTARTASCFSKTATSTTYRYTVQNGDIDSDGVTVGILSLNTTTIKDSVGNDATLTLNSIGVTTGVLVDSMIPTAASATSVTASGFTANWGSVSGTTGYYLDVATDNGFSNFVSGYSNKDVGNVVSAAVTGLAANTIYYYRVRTHGASGTSGSSSVITTLTATSAPAATAATAITFSGFTANWNSATGATGYYLDVATNDSFTNFVTGYENKDVGNVTSKTVTGLTTATTYYYRVRAYNSGGTGDNSTAISLTTNQNRIVTTVSDSGPGSLRQAISDSNSGDAITFDNSLNGQTITLTSGQLSIDKSISITGLTTSPGISISGNNTYRVFNLTDGMAALNYLTIANGNSGSSDGGGIYVGGGTLTVTNSTFSSNVSNWPGGGGIELRSGTANIINSTFIGNSAVSGGYGGAIDSFSGTTLNITNSTFFGNSAASAGGAISVGGTGTIVNSTISGNTAGWSNGGGGINNEAGTITVKNSIIANNPTGGNCFNHYNGYTFDGMNSLVDDTSCSSGFINSSSILLGTLGNYGGNTQTFPLLPGSSAINAGDDSLCAAAPVSGKDQRGIVRPQGGAACDIGAFESQGFTFSSPTGTPQSASPNTTFAQPLGLTVTANNAGEPVNNGVVTFSGPSAGASTNPVTNTATITNGAVSLSVTANGTPGSFNVTASAGGVATSAQFALTNLGVPDLTISTSDGGVSITPGGTIVYTLSYSNAGNQGVAGVVVSETVPANTTFNAAASTTGWSCANGSNGGTICNYTVGSLAAGASGSLTFAVTVALPIPGGVTQISNTVSIADNGMNGADPNPSNNSGSDTTTVNKLNTTTTLNSSANPATYGNSVTFTATVTSSAGTPSGTITFLGGSSTLGTGTLNASGQATFTTSALAVGTHSITAVYGGDTSFNASTSSAVSQTVNQASSTTNLSSSSNPSSLSQSVTFTATVPSGATGTVNFKDGATSITGCSAVSISGATATCATSALGTGSHTITASYSGDTNYAGSTSTALTQTVSLAPAFTSGNSTTFTIGTAGTFTVTTGGSPVPTLSITGTLPSGITFDAPTGVLSGTPAVGTNGTYSITFTASNGVSSTTNQNFTLTVAFNANPPVLTISTLPDGAVTTSSVLNVSGTVTGANGIQSLVVNGATVTLLSDGSFSYPVQLIAGTNTITTIATDTAGTTVSDTRTITLDSTAPVLTVTSPSDNKIVSQPNVTVTGTIGDQSASVTWSVNGSAPQAASQNGLTYSFTANLNGGINTIQITATSTTGTKSHIKRTISYQPVFSLVVTDPATDIRTPLGNYTLTGSVADNSTAVTITISMDGQTYSPTVTNGIFQQQLPFSSEKIYHIGVTATDQNSTSLTVQRNVIHTAASSSYTVADALLALQAAVGTATPTASQILKLDVAPMVNGVSVGDGKIGGDDALMILRMAVGLIQ